MCAVRAGRERVLGQPVLPNPASARTKGQGWMFAGYIPLRRGILEHVQKGLLNKTDFSVYCLLLLLADHHTGIWWGSAKALGAYNFARSTARNSLQRLESKGYIKRFTTPGVHANYQILINKYAITDGQHKGKLLDAKQTTSTKFLIYTSQQDGKHLGQHQGEHPAPIQEGRIEKKEKRKNPAQASPSPSGFSTFWDLYPRKVGKPAALKAYRGMRSGMRLALVLAGLKRWMQTEQWQKEDGKFIPYPATFLNQRRWEDEPGQEVIELGPRPRPEGKPGKCRDCGAEIPAGFLKCLECMKKKAPVNP
ncbi:hypothetical protein LCGC14_0466990 [marine sediment metagenome]|uniref:Bacteriophage lambda Replication protein O N-terminal domain-containing protein n=1 Tax=marine sediment metagenome TaxID=412755 RepID=A0A0F9SIN9_9ZZZZ